MQIRPSQETAIYTEDGATLTYQSLVDRAESLARAVSARDVVFTVCTNSVPSVAGYLAFLRADAVQLLLPEKIEKGALQGLIEAYRPRFVYLPRERSDLGVTGSEVASVDSYVLLKVTDESRHRVHEDVALLLTTSGSTGSPKLVRLSHANLASNAESIAGYLGISGGDRPITTMPMNYSYGLSILNSHFVRGAGVVLSGASVTEAAFWKTLKESKATTFGGVPYIFETLKRLRFERMELPFLRYLTQAGGRLSPALVREYVELGARRGTKFIVMYGQTEATARMSYVPWDQAAEKVGSIGVAIPGGEFWLENDQGGKVQEPGASGELVYRGPNVSLGYASSGEDLALGDVNQGVLRTGDVASFDAHGFYTIVGRKSRFLKVFGNRVGLDELEKIVRDAGFDCACTGRDDLVRVIVTDSAAPSVLATILPTKTGLHVSAFKISVVDQIPRTEAGKILYAQLGAED